MDGLATNHHWTNSRGEHIKVRKCTGSKRSSGWTHPTVRLEHIGNTPIGWRNAASSANPLCRTTLESISNRITPKQIRGVVWSTIKVDHPPLSYSRSKHMDSLPIICSAVMLHLKMTNQIGEWSMKRRPMRKTVCEAEGCNLPATRFVTDTSFGFCNDHAEFYKHDFKIPHEMIHEERMGKHLFKLLDNGNVYIISINGRIDRRTAKEFSPATYVRQYRNMLVHQQ